MLNHFLNQIIQAALIVPNAILALKEKHVPPGLPSFIVNLGLGLKFVHWLTSGPGAKEEMEFKQNLSKPEGSRKRFIIKGRGRTMNTTTSQELFPVNFLK
uniref:Uncharacterized protein n=1 Tax=Polytomella parva TaxID=51329 RepID=A0A7S0YJB1_9CHLO